jgi:hypothetical protein
MSTSETSLGRWESSRVACADAVGGASMLCYLSTPLTDYAANHAQGVRQ